jgi:hypothetical protein
MIIIAGRTRGWFAAYLNIRLKILRKPTGNAKSTVSQMDQTGIDNFMTPKIGTSAAENGLIFRYVDPNWKPRAKILGRTSRLLSFDKTWTA